MTDDQKKLAADLCAFFEARKTPRGDALMAMAIVQGIVIANSSPSDYPTGVEHIRTLILETAKATLEPPKIEKPKPATAYTIPINSDGEVDDVVQHTTDENRVEYRDGKFVIGSKS